MKKNAVNTHVCDERENNPLHVETANGKREKWRGKIVTWPFLTLAVCRKRGA